MKNDESMQFGEELAKQHVDWLLKMLRPLLVDHMVHGFKHGLEYEREAKVLGEEAWPYDFVLGGK